MTEATRIKIRRLRTEIAFLHGDECIGGPSHAAEKKKLADQIAELEAKDGGGD